MNNAKQDDYVRWFEDLNSKDVGQVGGKNASLGEMVQAIAEGRVSVIKSAHQIGQFQTGAVLVTTMTDPDWVPIMKRAAAIVTDQGGRTSHAAIVSRERGIPAIVGAEDATQILKQDQEVTASCAKGDHH